MPGENLKGSEAATCSTKNESGKDIRAWFPATTLVPVGESRALPAQKPSSGFSKPQSDILPSFFLVFCCFCFCPSGWRQVKALCPFLQKGICAQLGEMK